MKELTVEEKARQARREYMRRYREKNRQRIRQKEKDRWARLYDEGLGNPCARCDCGCREE